MEYFDLYDRNRKPLGITHPRGEPVPPGAFVLVAEIWTVNSKGQLLLTLRHPAKGYGGLWEVTGGAVQAGEATREAAARELFEETGIKASAEELTFVCEKPDGAAFIDSYLLRRDAAPEDLTMQEGETTAARWVTFPEFRQMSAAGELAFGGWYGGMMGKLEEILGNAAQIR
jgi:8-oxo-dGTP pyrophosphatase MutT (NUDIX family)